MWGEKPQCDQIQFLKAMRAGSCDILFFPPKNPPHIQTYTRGLSNKTLRPGVSVNWEELKTVVCILYNLSGNEKDVSLTVCDVV